MRGNTRGAPGHATKAEAATVSASCEARAVVLHGELSCLSLNVKIDVDLRRARVTNAVADCFLTNSKHGFGNWFRYPARLPL